MMTALLVSLAGLLPSAHASGEISHEQFFQNAKPLILEFVAAKSTEYGIDLQLDDATWTVRNSNYIRHPMSFDLFFGGRYDWECRVISAVVKGSNERRAHFSVRVSYPDNAVVDRGQNPRYELVPTCNRLDLAAKSLELRIEGLPKDREFSDEEVATVTIPLIRNFLRDQGKSTEVDMSTVGVRRRGIDDDRYLLTRWYRKLFGRNIACRRVRVYLPAENQMITSFVSIFYDSSTTVPYLSESTQAIFRDKISLRPYRFALSDGCDSLGLFEKPRLRLKPYRKISPAKKPSADPAPEARPPGPAPIEKESPGPKPSAS